MSELLSQTPSANQSRRRRPSPAAFSIGMLLGLFAACLFVVYQNRSAPAPQPVETDMDKTVALIGQAMQQVRSDYIDEISPQELAEAALEGMFTRLDEHSRYLDEQTYQNLVQQTDGEYLGIGIEIESQDGAITVVSVLDDSPAARIGLQADDLIVAVNGQDIEKLPAADLLNEIRHAVNSVLALSVQRGDENFDVQLTRDMIIIASVESFLITPANKSSLSNTPKAEAIAYVRIRQFNENTASDLQNILDRFLLTEHSLYGLVLDLRNNPGGLVTSAVEVADLFLHSGTIVSANGRASDADFVFQAQVGESFADIPVVVLINGATASAAEIVAAALQEQDRAILLGEQSFGKGLVQTIIPIDSGALKLTTSRYYTPSGLSINERGIRPNIT
ncbi:MAG: S41 family peptidase, partial [Gammaproteobacteria bacterium]|nr:S41 family peptidase [Gammaproteobacteria bacterium]